MRRVVIMLMVALTSTGWGVAHASPDVGQPAPALVTKELDGQTFDLAQLRGKVVIVNFWATWCSSCREEMPALDAFYRQYGDKGLAIIGLSADRLHERSEVAKTMRSYSYPAAMMRDAESNGFGSPTELPTTYLIDRDGVVRAKLTPDETKLNQGTLTQLVLPLLSAKIAASAPAPVNPQ